MSEEQRGVEISNPTLGAIKIFGMDPNMLFTVFTFVMATAAAVFLFMHMDESKASGKEAVQVLKESNKEIASILKETSRETNQILKEMARATREQNCLLSVPQERRAAMAETCRRIAQ